MRQTVVGVFDRYAAARQAAQQLRDSGFADSVYVTDELEGERFDGTRTDAPARDEGGVMAHVRHFFSDLFGSDEKEVGPYAEAVRRGGAIVKVEVEADEEADRARAALEAAGAVDIDERASEWRASGWQEGSSLMPPESVGGTAPLATSTTTGGVRVFPRDASLGDEVGSSAWRSHFDSTYASSGALWEDYEPAYRWGDSMRSDSRYRGRSWDEVEPELQRDWEGRQGFTWERVKAAVRHTWDRMTG